MANSNIVMHTKPYKYQTNARFLWCLCGLCGLHRCYLGQPNRGLCYLFTCGGCLVCCMCDGCRLRVLVDEYNTSRPTLVKTVTQPKTAEAGQAPVPPRKQQMSVRAAAPPPPPQCYPTLPQQQHHYPQYYPGQVTPGPAYGYPHPATSYYPSMR